MNPVRKTIMVATPVGPLELDFADHPAFGPARLYAHGRLTLPDGPLDTVLYDIATLDVARRRVYSDRRRLRRALRAAHGPRRALALIPILVPALEQALASERALIVYAEIRARQGVPPTAAPAPVAIPSPPPLSARRALAASGD
jgi:hypothetical protein